jgi:hypothetical protein
MPGAAADQAHEQRQVDRAQRVPALVVLGEDPLGELIDLLAQCRGHVDEGIRR